MRTIGHIQKEVRRIGKLLCGENIPTYLFSVAGSPTHSGAPHVELVGDEYHYVITERGSEYDRRKTKDIDELLYWFVSDDVSQLARDWELERRVENQDSRRLWFKKELELLEKVKPDWAVKKESHQLEVLSEHPFNDSYYQYRRERV